MLKHQDLLRIYGAILVACAALGPATGVEARQSPDRETVDLAAVALTIEDVGPGFTLDVAASPFSATVGGGLASYQVGYSKSPLEVLTGTGPMYVMNGLFTIPGAPLPPGILDEVLSTVLTAVATGAEASFESAARVEGPEIGEQSGWLVLTGSSLGIPFTVHAVGFQASDVVVLVMIGSILDRGGQDDAAQLAQIVAERLGGPPSPSPTPALTLSPTATSTPLPSATATPVPTTPVPTTPTRSATVSPTRPAGTPRPGGM